MSKENIHDIDDLLVKQLLGEATEAEQAAVSTWLGESEANRQHYAQLQQVWDASKKLEATSVVDEDAAWQRFKQRVDAAPKTESRTIPLQPKKSNWLRVAATLLLLVTCGSIYYYTYMGSTTTYMADNTVTTETLPDGTVVTLNKNASIKFDNRFNGDTRSVTLTGEAFFDVTPDKSKPFIITAGDAQIKVVGTSFNVKSNDTKTEVIVETGIVEVSKKENMVKLLPKEKATVLESKATPTKERVEDALYSYYRTKELVCNNTPLWRLVDVLNDVYNANIEIADTRLREMPITTTFKNETLDNILNVVAGTQHIRVIKNGNRIILTQ